MAKDKNKESSTFKFTRFREKVVPNRKRDVKPDIDPVEERRPMEKVYVVVYIDENSNETVAAFTTKRDAEIAAVAIVEDKASLWEIPITENTTDGDKLGMVDNWSILTSQRESLGVFDCPLNILDRRDYA
jgi:hypothetical protein